MAARFVRDEEVVGSNPATPTAVRPGQGPDPKNRIRPLSGFRPSWEPFGHDLRPDPQGQLQWVNAGHPAPLLIRGRAVVDRLESPTTLPVGFGGEDLVVSERTLRPGDRLLCFIDGLIEEHQAGGEQFGEEQVIESTNRVVRDHTAVRSVVRVLSHTLKQERGGVTSDDATIFLIEWRGGDADHLATLGCGVTGPDGDGRSGACAW
ncbi:hypothetical protein GCM10015535_49670 [Streptomyces gelaticus]|uniref:PPM-type phosphatase domain-containing protein n=1 Tax=Streptomyces gelaticus TaxID=285446 RepID=A0ABQ2W6K1_9ACTN|nr:hypothetical protein GCM10015535_49670 [Streptomyces gelaticus]